MTKSPSGFVDLHAHVLPRVDDGPKNLQASVELLRLAHKEGTRIVVATPHMFLFPFGNEDPADLWRVYLGLLESLDRLKNDPETAFLEEMRVYLGAEHFFSTAFVEALENGKVLPLKDTRSLLVEFSPLHSMDEIVGGVRQVTKAGYVPVLAHVERYRGLQYSPNRAAELRELGAVIQVNAGALVGWPVSRVGRTAWALLRAGLVDIVASDAHNTGNRRPLMKKAAENLERRLSKAQATELTQLRPARVIGLTG